MSKTTTKKKTKPVTIEQATALVKMYIASFPFGNRIHMLMKTKLPQDFFENHVVCMKCGHVEEKASYAIAQRAMGHTVTFTCECKNKFEI